MLSLASAKRSLSLGFRGESASAVTLGSGEAWLAGVEFALNANARDKEVVGKVAP